MLKFMGLQRVWHDLATEQKHMLHLTKNGSYNVYSLVCFLFLGKCWHFSFNFIQQFPMWYILAIFYCSVCLSLNVSSLFMFSWKSIVRNWAVLHWILYKERIQEKLILHLYKYTQIWCVYFVSCLCAHIYL